MILSKSSSTASAAAVLLLISLLTTTVHVEASFPANTSSYFNIQIPYSLHVHNRTGGMMHHTARFGSHWDNFEGNLVLPLHDVNGNLCTPLDANQTKALPQNKPFLMLVSNEGFCTPESKVRQAQAVGAAGVVLFHHRCLCEDEKNETCKDNNDKNQCVERLPYLGEGSGNGNDISIPSLLVAKQEGLNMKKEIKNGKAVVVEMAWHWPKMNPSADPPEKVRLDFWHTPVDEHTQTFLSNMSFIVAQMQDTLEFNPHFYFLDGKDIDCFQHANLENEQCYPMCSNNGRYCSWGSHGVTGNQTITETLRRKCILKHYPKLYWNYIDVFHNKCGQSKDFYSSDECIQDVYSHAGKIDTTQIDDCIRDSGGLVDDHENTLLEEELKWSKNTVVKTPNLWINWVPYRWGPLDPKWVLDTICHGFVYGQAPHICHVCAHCGDPALCASRNPMSCHADDGVEPEPSPTKKKSHKKKNKAAHFFIHFFWFTVLVGGLAAGFIYYKRNYMEEGVGGGMGYQNLGMALMSDRT